VGKTEYLTVTLTLGDAVKLANLLADHRPDGFAVPSWAQKLVKRILVAARMQTEGTE
jgi:hypothetical protein